MENEKQNLILPEDRILTKIVVLREEKVILDMHLAELYGVETRVLKQAVRRNMERFPADFMFQLTENEVDAVVSQSVIPSRSHLGGGTPFAFTEAGIAMLSSVLKSPTAIEMNITIMRTFVALRKMSVNYQEVMRIVQEMRGQYDAQFEEVFNLLDQLVNAPQTPRKMIGFKADDE